jgi:hypothetical protein
MHSDVIFLTSGILSEDFYPVSLCSSVGLQKGRLHLFVFFFQRRHHLKEFRQDIATRYMISPNKSLIGLFEKNFGQKKMGRN